VNHGLSDQVRAVALEKFVFPAIHAGKRSFSVSVRDLMHHLEAQGFPTRNWPQVCTAIQAEKFLRAHGLEIEGVDGPPKKLSTTVVVRYRITDSAANTGSTEAGPTKLPTNPDETPEQWAHRMTGKLFGLMKEELTAFGGGEAFLRWVRSEGEKEEA
jgi:hypothetical protein